MRESVIGHLGTARLRRGYPPGPLLRAQQFYSQTRRMRSGMCWSTITRTTRETPAGFRVLRPVLGEGPADRRGSRLEAPAKGRWRRPFNAARRYDACSAHDRGDRRDDCQTPGNLRPAGRSPRKRCSGWRSRSPGRSMFSFEMSRHGPTFAANFVMEYGARLAAAASARPDAAARGWPKPAGFFPRARFPQALDEFRGHADGGNAAPAGKNEGAAPPCDLFDLMVARGADPEDRRCLHRRAARRPGRHHDSRRS